MKPSFNNESFSLSKKSVHNFKKMLITHEKHFFEVAQLEEIIDYYTLKNCIKEAMVATEYALTLHPKSVQLLLKKAGLLIETNDYQKALFFLEKVETQVPTEHDLFFYKGIICIKQGENFEAELAFKNAKQFTQNNLEEHNLAVALTFEQNKEFHIALKYFLKVLTENSTNTFVLFHAGICAEKLGEFKHALSFYQQYLKEEPNNEKVWYNCAVLYEKLGKISLSIEAYDISLTIKPTFGNALFNKAGLLFKLKSFEKSAKLYETFLEVETQNVTAICYLADSYVGLKVYQKAENTYKKALKINEKATLAWQGIAELSFEQGKFLKSFRYIEKAIELEPKNAEFAYIAAISLWRIGKLNEAAQFFQNAITSSPKNYRYWLEYSDMLHEYTTQEKAEDALRTALSVLPNCSKIMFRLAAYQLFAKKETEAKNTLQMAIEKSPQQSKYFTSFFENDFSVNFLKNCTKI